MGCLDDDSLLTVGNPAAVEPATEPPPGLLPRKVSDTGLRKAWAAAQRASRDDWFEWLRRCDALISNAFHHRFLSFFCVLSWMVCLRETSDEW
jgi:hypothetical protein